MKTCLYNPVFINPQAYYVFPQLYTMQPKTDNLIEYAKYTGQLIVTDVTNNDTYTVYSRSNGIDLSDFAEKRNALGLATLPSEDAGQIEWTYPNYEYNTKELNNLLNSSEWASNEENI